MTKLSRQQCCAPALGWFGSALLGWMLWAAPLVPLWGLFAPTAAFAHEPQTKASYDQLIRQALQEFSLGHWTEARVFFANAHALQPNARTLRGLALTCYESRSYVEALGFFELALSNQVQPLTAQMRRDIEQLRTQARQFVSRAVLELEPRGAEVLIDDSSVHLDAKGAVLLDPGQHEILVRAQHFEPEKRSVVAVDGKEVRLWIALTPRAAPPLRTLYVAAPPAAPGGGVAAAVEPSSPEEKLGPWIVVVASGVIAIAGGVCLGLALSDKAVVEHAKSGTTWSELKGPYDRGMTLFPVGFTLLGAGVAGATAGLAWKFWPNVTDRERSATLHILPGGLSVSGRL